MGKVSGKTGQFWFDSVERSFDTATYDVEYAELDTTDSSTVSPATDSVLGRATRTLKVDATLEMPLGTEVTTGTLTKDVKYVVTGGTIGSYGVGKIFTSLGTETATGTNKVKPVGAKLTGDAISCTVGGSAFPVTALKFNEQYGKFDATDSTTAAGATDSVMGRATMTTTIEGIMLSTVADALVSAPAAQAVVLTLGTGMTFTGSAIFKKKSAPISAKGDMVKVTYEVNWKGAVVNTLTNLLTPAVSKAFKLIYETGASTNKEVTGNAIIMSTSIDVDINSLVKVSYSMDIVGAATEAVAN